MNRAAAAATLLVAASIVGGCASTAGSDAGWVTLIDGAKGLENWDRVGDANWRAEDGAIVADGGKGGFLVTKRAYQDFQIRAEFWAAANANSGVYMRCADPKVLTDKSCYEANIFDQRPDPTYGTGAIVHHAGVPHHKYKAGGQWNVYDITVKGNEVTVNLNGVQTAKLTHDQFKSGPIGLQYGTLPPKGEPGGAIKWRKVQIRPL
jgi:hypothetical protein